MRCCHRVLLAEQLEHWEFPNAYIKHLSADLVGQEKPFEAIYLDWIDSENQMLVLTWPAREKWDQDLLLDEVPKMLQIWDVDATTLIELLPFSNVVYGRFTPDRANLIYGTVVDQKFELHLMNIDSEEIAFTAQIVAKEGDYNFELVDPQISFSNDGRYLTYFESESTLIVFDIERGQEIGRVNSAFQQPEWSPSNAQFFYQNERCEFLIFDTIIAQSFPLSVSGRRRTCDPQWSFDGSHISLPVLQEDGSVQIAILKYIGFEGMD